MSVFHCSCGFAIDCAEEFADHLHQSFGSDDDIGTDGRIHYELADTGPAMHGCACGFATRGVAEFDDHLLMAFIAPDSIGSDGAKHVPADPSTPDRWYVRRAIDG
jgi:hypothetical protein